MQKKVLVHFLVIIPLEFPKLEVRLYTKVLEHLIERSEYKVLHTQALKIFPPYLVNSDHLIEVLKRQIESQPTIKNDKDVLEVLFLLHE